MMLLYFVSKQATTNINLLFSVRKSHLCKEKWKKKWGFFQNEKYQEGGTLLFFQNKNYFFPTFYLVLVKVKIGID
jgi:hypothetical protein